MQKFVTTIAHTLLACLFLVSALVDAFPAQAAPLPNGPSDPAELEAFLDGLISARMEEEHVPGVVVAVVKDGAVLLKKGYGYADLETHTPVDPERTLFRLASVSKLFIWTSVMQLFEQGKLDLDADINTYLDFTIPATLRQAQGDASAEPITLKHLLTHTAGFEENAQDVYVLRAEAMKSLGEYLKTNIPARVFAPGKVFAYSNYGASLAGYIVECISGLSFDAYVEQNIFAPLGMQHSTFRQPLPNNLAANMAGGYRYSGGAYQKGDFLLTSDYPASGLSATATDMARFMIAHLQNGLYEDQRILQEATAIQMHQPLFTHDPRLGGMAYGFFEDIINGQQVISHGGDLIFFHSDLFLLPEQNLGVFISTNSTSGGKVRNAIMDAFIDRYYPTQGTQDPQPPADFAARITPYLGEYTESRGNFTTFQKIYNLFSPVRNITLNEDGYLSMGDDELFVEIEPGLLQSRYEPNSRLAYHTDANGQQYLFPTRSSHILIKTPWYGSVTLHQKLLLANLVFFGVALLRWPYGFFKSMHKREPQPTLARLAHWNAGLFGMLLIALALCSLVITMDKVPTVGVMRLLFADAATPLLSVILFLPWLLALTGFAMPVFSLLAWVKKFWSLGGRIFYTLLTLCALAGIWVLTYWNLWL